MTTEVVLKCLPSSAFCNHSTKVFICSRNTVFPLAEWEVLYHFRTESSLNTSAEEQIYHIQIPHRLVTSKYFVLSTLLIGFKYIDFSMKVYSKPKSSSLYRPVICKWCFLHEQYQLPYILVKNSS